MDDIAQTITCRQLFAGHVLGSRPMKRKKHLQRMIMIFERFLNSFEYPGFQSLLFFFSGASSVRFQPSTGKNNYVHQKFCLCCSRM